jgi:DNA-binding transcriptional MerR regulator
MTELDIGAVIRATGLPASTLHYYEERGLITPAGRHGLRRQYDAGVLDRLGLIALLQTAGFSLDEIAPIVAPDGAPRIDRAQLAARADAIDAQVLQLQALSNGLRHAAACPAPSHMECPTFRGMVEEASRRSPAAQCRAPA